MLRAPRVLAAVRKGLEWVDDTWAAAQAQITELTVAVGFLQPGGSRGAFGWVGDDLLAELAPPVS